MPITTDSGMPSRIVPRRIPSGSSFWRPCERLRWRAGPPRWMRTFPTENAAAPRARPIVMAGIPAAAKADAVRSSVTAEISAPAPNPATRPIARRGQGKAIARSAPTSSVDAPARPQNAASSTQPSSGVIGDAGDGPRVRPGHLPGSPRQDATPAGTIARCANAGSVERCSGACRG